MRRLLLLRRAQPQHAGAQASVAFVDGKLPAQDRGLTDQRPGCVAVKHELKRRGGVGGEDLAEGDVDIDAHRRHLLGPRMPGSLTSKAEGTSGEAEVWV